MKQSGYYRFPTISGNKIVFVCEEDLWSVDADGGQALRLSSNHGEVTRPYLSPDGKWIAYTGREEGNAEIYVMPSSGGTQKCLTFLGANSTVVGWTSDSKYILFSSNSRQPFLRMLNLYKVPVSGGEPENLNLGHANNISYGKKGAVLGINTTDPARWKRYKGGTAGVLWIDTKGKGNFNKLIDLKGNMACPMWIGDRIYFIADHEGIGNLYSCTPEGKDLEKHTENKDFYVRNATTDGKRVVYHSGADIFLFDPKKNKSKKVEIDFYSPQIHRQRKFVIPNVYLEDYHVHPEGHSISLNTRGKGFAFPSHDGVVSQIGEVDGVRYRLTQWLDKDRIITISDKGGKEAIEIHENKFDAKVKRFESLDIGMALNLKPSPIEDKFVLSNQRYELVLVDLKKKTRKILDKSKYSRIDGFDWSPDGKWVTYSCCETHGTASIKICNIETGETHLLTDTRFRDFSPSFDPEGKFIYFLSYREFNPVYDSVYFDLSFPRSVKPCLISLKKETLSPFAPIPKFLKEEEKKDDKKDKKDDKKKDKEVVKVEIDFDGIFDRVATFPVPEGRYIQVWGLKGKVLLSNGSIKGAINNLWYQDTPETGINLEYYDFENHRTEAVAYNISDFKVSSKNDVLVYRSGYKLRTTHVLPYEKNRPSDDKPGRKSGWIDFSRIKISVNPIEEWKQMFTEMWRLQKLHFWDENMCGIDWDKAYKKYFTLLNRVASRSEFSDLAWELQGELGTSHAYETGGDYRHPPHYKQGLLGADFKYDEKSGGYKITHIAKGDAWNEKENSSLSRMGVNVSVGDILLAVNNQKLDKNTPPNQLLINRSNQEVMLTFAGKKKGEYREVMVRPHPTETHARYREWVENNREKVRKATNGKVGYVHVPDMGPHGFAEFHRYYFAEVDKDSVIIDVRYNGGGHVSQLLLEKIARKRIAYNVNRWGSPEPYPSDSILGSTVAITNEHAGSDGDIFSHNYKQMKLGKLIGKRTWGGVIGIWPRHKLVDGSVTTQPEFSFWFTDVGWKVENYGTEPDIEVDYKPQDWAKNHDPQLEKAIEVILEEMKNNPPKLPNFDNKPNLGGY